ncbi:hypothetical protein R0137_06680 [Congregibacter brevis]|uniref:Peptidase MA superfamily protein n=1 Tax=Congregibacter brevis TaxID=3081201 RepID=A0ABZ0IFF8_9GAMM|nr:hypothetical protein R0137_06680 [Congregibacter sp. IMCC45268]
MEGSSTLTHQQKAVMRGVVLGVVAGLCLGALAVAVFYEAPLATPTSSASAPAQSGASPTITPHSLAASDCAVTSPAVGGPVVDSPAVTGKYAGFSIRIEAEGTTLSEDLELEIAEGATYAYAQWREWLGEKALRPSQINIRFLGDAQRFREIYGKPNREEWTTTGFYRMRSNEALILYTPAFRSSALGNAFHEISHLITARHLGATPPWLNEGLAELYETLHIVDGAVSFSENKQHLALLKLRGPVSMEALTQLSRETWMLKDAERRYASAWALIAFLMDTDLGKQTLRSTILEAYSGRCGTRSDFRDTLSRYPGGSSALQSDWLNWLNIRYSALNKLSGGITADSAL